jgi:hypothetical protein
VFRGASASEVDGSGSGGAGGTILFLIELAQDISEAKVRSLREAKHGLRDREARESHEYRLYFSQSLSSLSRLATESISLFVSLSCTFIISKNL